MKKERTRPSEVFAARLSETRKARRVSQAELARAMTQAGYPMDKAAVLRVEKRKRGLSLDEALAFAAVLSAVPVHLLTPSGDEMVWLTENSGVDGAGMRAWLRYGDAFIADSGDLPDELFADRAQRAMAVHAQALVDAIRANDKAGRLEAFRALEETVLDERARNEEQAEKEKAEKEKAEKEQANA